LGARKRERHEEFYLEPDDENGAMVVMWDPKGNDWKELTLSEFVELAQDLAETTLENANYDSLLERVRDIFREVHRGLAD
jgi:hypothetical protein